MNEIEVKVEVASQKVATLLAITNCAHSALPPKDWRVGEGTGSPIQLA
jgi:hypothetical protein